MSPAVIIFSTVMATLVAAMPRAPASDAVFSKSYKMVPGVEDTQTVGIPCHCNDMYFGLFR